MSPDTSLLSSKPTFCRTESPSPRWVDSPPSFFTDFSSNPFHEHPRLRQPVHHCFCNHFLCVSSLAFYQVYPSTEQICPAKVSHHLPTCFYGPQPYLNFQTSLWGRSHRSAGDLYGQQNKSLSPVSLVFSGSPTTDSAVTSIQ